MNEKKEDRISIYEIGYLIATSVPEEKVPAEAEAIKGLVTGAGASIIADEQPYKQPLAYTMRKKNVSGSYEKYDSAYFGWVKFELASDAAEALKNKVETHPSVLRMIIIKTVRENTYLGKHASAIAATMGTKRTPQEGAAGDKPEEKKDAAPATVEEMDKSIDDMVKEV